MSCTNSPNGDFNYCCQEHDAYYEDTSISRWKADKKLFMCIIKANSNDRSIIAKAWHILFVAPLYWIAVRSFGWTRYGKGAVDGR